MAKEAAARFGTSRTISNQALSPSELSESNFRTPVPAPRRGWFHIAEDELNSHASANTVGSGAGSIKNANNAVGLLLPGLFASASEEDLGRHSRSSSWLDLMKEAFSPTK